MITINLYAERLFKNSFNMILNIHLVYCFFLLTTERSDILFNIQWNWQRSLHLIVKTKKRIFDGDNHISIWLIFFLSFN